MRHTITLFLSLTALGGALFGCGDETPNRGAQGARAADSDEPRVLAQRPRVRASVREGGALVRSVRGEALYVADEDHAVVRRVPLPVDVNTPASEIDVPGRPAQVLALDDRLLVTIRDPGLLLVLDVEGQEVSRTVLAADAWGVAVTPDEKMALVSSAWTHQVSAVDLEDGAVRWTVDVAREPRGIVVSPDGDAAYVTHLVGTALTKLTSIAGPAPAARRVALPAAPLRARWNGSDDVGASLGYAAVSNPEGTRLYVARHALGALGPSAWFGASTVDVLVSRRDEPLAPRRTAPAFQSAPMFGGGFDEATLLDVAGTIPTTSATPFVQPRAMVYRTSTRTVLVAGEGTDTLTELDAEAVAPALQPLRTYKVGFGYGDRLQIASGCGAPTGIALSADESMAYVFCRSTTDVAIVTLDVYDEAAPFQPGPIPFVHLADDTARDEVALGRRLFYDANDDTTSGGLGCAGCHPEGRDDGFVWHEMARSEFDQEHVLLGTAFTVDASGAQVKQAGQARQTPMLAGRVSAIGPYGWLAESPTLERRVRAGFKLHRWFQAWREASMAELHMRESSIAAFLREGLVPPARHGEELTTEESRGKELFMSESTQCSGCHVFKTETTDRSLSPLRRLPARRGFDEDSSPAFRVPSLLFVGGTAPYFHDGHASTLEQLVDQNHDRMGKTDHLSSKDRAALVAFLRTL